MTDEQVFSKAICLSESERQEFLDLMYLGRPQERHKMESMIAAHRQSDSLLDTDALSGETVVADRPAVPRRIGDFEILRELGRGGMGVVYEALQKSLKRKVALKVLSSGLGLSSKAILRFRREAEAAGKLHHTNIVPIYTTGEDRGIHYYAMELINGPSLDAVIRDLRNQDHGDRLESNYDKLPAWVQETALYAPQSSIGADKRVVGRSAAENRSPLNLPDSSLDVSSCEEAIGHGVSDYKSNSSKVDESLQPNLAATTASAQFAASAQKLHSNSTTARGASYFDTVAAMIAEVADALDHAHEHGVIHRDVKPSNLLLAPDGRLSINDFGLARVLEQPGMTISGEFVGSPLYMSPEQITAGRAPLDHRTDIYSLGATLYELLTSQPPFPGDTRDQVLGQILHKEPKTPRQINRKVPVDLDTICMKAIERDPDRRYQTAGQLAKDLRAYVDRHAISARRIGPATRAVRYLKRNPVAAAFLCFVIATGIGGLSLWLWQEQRSRTAAVEKAQEDLIEDLFRGDLSNADDLILLAEQNQASQEQLDFMEGLTALFEQDYSKAIRRFDNASSLERYAVASVALKAFAALWNAEEYEYFRLMHDVDVSEAHSFEDFFFLGYASSWSDPELSEQLLLKAQEIEHGHPYVRFLLGVARSNIGMVVSPTPSEAYTRLKSAIRDISQSDVPRTAFYLRELACSYVCLHRVSSELAQHSSQRGEEFASEATASKLRAIELIPELRELETQSGAQFALVILMIQMDELREEILSITDEWLANDEISVMIYAAQFLALHYAEEGDTVQAKNWTAHFSGRIAEGSQFINVLVDLLVGGDWQELHDRQLDNVRRKLRTGETEYLGHDLTLLYLLGTDRLAEYSKSRLVPLIHDGRLFSPITTFLAGDRSNESRKELIRQCKDSPAPISSLMHAHFYLGMIDLAEGRTKSAKLHLELAKNGRQPMYWVAMMSHVILAREDEWGAWLNARQEFLSSSAVLE